MFKTNRPSLSFEPKFYLCSNSIDCVKKIKYLGFVLTTIDVARIFDWGEPKPQITCNDVIRNFERGTFCGGKDTVEWKIRSCVLVLPRNYELVQGRGLKLIVKMRKCLNLGHVWWVKKCTVIQTYCRRGSGGGPPSRRRLWESGGEAPSRWAIFCNFLEKKAILIPFDHILDVFSAIWKY